MPERKKLGQARLEIKKLIALEEPTEQLRLAIEMADKLAKELPIDRRRIYITGLSMGGFGTWDAVVRRPNFFAAAVPICGGGDVEQAAKLKNLPIWAFHGDADPVVPVEGTTAMIESIRKSGGEPKMTIYPEVGTTVGQPPTPIPI